MNEFEEFTASQLDRFVDGELSDSKRRELLLAADREPDGWRRLALAFVESQTLRCELTALMKPLPNESARAASPSTNIAARSGGLRMTALVACSLIAFGLGRWSSSAEERVARVPNPPASSPRTFASDPNEEIEVADASTQPVETHQTLRLVLDDLLGGPSQTVDVAVVDDFPSDPRELLTGPPVISPEIQRALLRAGRRVHEERQLFEVQLSDGRRGVVPVSNVLVENVGLNVFQ